MFELESYSIIVKWFPRLVGGIYFLAFFPFLFQIRGLLGQNGILPIGQYLNSLIPYLGAKKYYIIPSLFWWNSSDRALVGLVVLGLTAAQLLLFGYMPALMLLILYISYLSLVSTGQDFLSFGWEGLLLETTAHAFFLSLTETPNLLVWVSLNFLLFRFHVQAGLVKLQSGDPTWRDLTAIAYHYQTQPLPNVIAWYVHKLPLSLHKISCASMFFIEIVCPLGIWGNQEMRLIAFGMLLGLQLLIGFTGNFSYLNYLTVVLCTILLNNQALEHMGFEPSQFTPVPFWQELFVTLGGAFLFALQFIRGWQQMLPNRIFEKILSHLSHFYLANRYGIFAVMTTKRYEIVIEGSLDGQVWQEYAYRYKPSELTRPPRWIAPYQPRLDWQTWFLPFSRFSASHWFQNFLVHLLKGTPEVLSLLRINPFAKQPPKYIRVLVYDYVFSTWREKRQQKRWWQRTLVGYYTPTIMLQDAKVDKAPS